MSSFWKWLGSLFKRGFKPFCMDGGWVIFPLFIHGFLLHLLGFEQYAASTLLWIFPFGLTATFSYWKKFVKEKVD